MFLRIAAMSLLVVWLFGFAPALAVEGPLRLGSDRWPPFTDDGGQPRIAIELVEAALARVGVQAETKIVADFSTVLRDLKEGELDGSPAIWRTPDRAAFLRFSKPYLENRLVLLGRQGADLSATALSDLAGKRVAVVEGYGYGPVLEGVGGPTLVFGRSDQANLRKLLSGEVDYLLADDLLIHELFEHYGDRADRLLAVSSRPLLRRSLYFAVRRDLDGAAALLTEFDEAVETMIEDGTYHRIVGVTWLWADVDEDGSPEFVLGGDRAGMQEPDDAYVVSGPEEPAAGVKNRRYYVDGKMYESWQQVPPQYRLRQREDVQRPRSGGLLFEW